MLYHVRIPHPFLNCFMGLNGHSRAENQVRVSCEVDLHNVSMTFLSIFYCLVTFFPHGDKNAGKYLES